MSVRFSAGDTLRTSAGYDRESEGARGKRRERSIAGKLRSTAGDAGLEEMNPMRGAARVSVNNGATVNAASRG